MKRRQAREIVFKLTFEMVMTGEFNPDTREELLADVDADSRDYVVSVTNGIASKKEELKRLISELSKGFAFERIYKVDLAILYAACYEILYTDIPHAVVANEAVELAKKYSDTKSHTYINGILAAVIRGDGHGDN